MKLRWIKNILTVIVLLATGAYIYWYFTRPVEDVPIEYETQAAHLKSLNEMAQLATLDFHEEIAVKDNQDGKWIVARMTVEGSVRYDLDSLRLEQRGDSILLIMPRERFDILESTDPGAYEILDSWDSERAVFSRKLTAAEENKLKQRASDRLEATLRKRGYVKRARDNARTVLTPLLRKLVTDSTATTAIIFTD